jgi:hypothetical protein
MHAPACAPLLPAYLSSRRPGSNFRAFIPSDPGAPLFELLAQSRVVDISRLRTLFPGTGTGASSSIRVGRRSDPSCAFLALLIRSKLLALQVYPLNNRD